MLSVAFKGRRMTMQSEIATMWYDARREAMSFSNIMLESATFKKDWHLKKVALRCRASLYVVALSLYIMALSLRVVALSLRVVECRGEQKYRPWHATMRYDAWQCDTTHDNMRRYFIKCHNLFLTFTLRHPTMRSDTQQYKATLDNAKRYSSMRSDILTNIISYCLESTGGRSKFNNTQPMLLHIVECHGLYFYSPRHMNTRSVNATTRSDARQYTTPFLT
jgi:hypothetical protein